MAPRILRNHLEGSRDCVLWIEYSRYAHRVFANSARDWLREATRYANTIIQARRAIRTEVLTIDISVAGLAAAPSGDPVARCKAALADVTARRYTTACIDAVLHTLGEDIDLVLQLPAPCDLWVACGGHGAADFDALDEIGTAMTAALRSYSQKSIAGLLLTRAADAALNVDEADTLAPVLNAAHHYRWVTCMAVSSAFLDSHAAAIDDVDLVLCSELPIARMRELRRSGLVIGGGLTSLAWSVTGGMPTRESGDLLFGSIPEDADPETVLANCAALIS